MTTDAAKDTFPFSDAISRHTVPNAMLNTRVAQGPYHPLAGSESRRETALFDEQPIQGFLTRQKPERGRTWWDG